MADISAQQNDKKTVVAFIVGLLIGGLLVWAFSGPSANAPAKTEKADDAAVGTDVEGGTMGSETVESVDDEEAAVSAPKPATLPVGEGKVTVADNAAGTKVVLSNVTFPVGEGWVGVRDFNNDRLGGLLGVARFSAEQGLVPAEVILQRGTRAGNTYAIVMFTESGDRAFSMANDVQIDTVYATFTAK